MSLLKRIRPPWLRALVRFALFALVGQCSAVLVIGICAIIVSYVPPFNTWDPPQQIALIGNLLVACALIGLLVLVWVWYIRWRRSHANTLYLRGNQLFGQQSYQDALVHYEQALAFAPKQLRAWWKKESCLSRLGRYEEAIAADDRILALDPRSASALSNKGYFLNRLGRYLESLTAYAQAVQLAPQSARAWLGMGVAHARLKRYDEALADLTHALELDPVHALAWNNKASILGDYLQRYDEALAVCDDAIARGVSLAGIWAVKGDALHALGREAEARIAYEQTLTYPADEFLSWASHGSALAGAGRSEEALAAYDQALTFSPHYPSLWRKKAEALRALGREDEALEAEQRAETLDR